MFLYIIFRPIIVWLTGLLYCKGKNVWGCIVEGDNFFSFHLSETTDRLPGPKNISDLSRKFLGNFHRISEFH